MNNSNIKSALVRDFSPDRNMFVDEQGVKTHRDFLEDLSKIVCVLQKMPPDIFLVNICEHRYFFTLAFSAGLVCGITNLLPQNRQPETLQVLEKKYGRLIVVADYLQKSQQADLYVSDLLNMNQPYDMVMPFIDHNHLAAIAFTSGSTGEPQPNNKYWKTLSGAADKMATRILSGIKTPLIVATVPSQHMYGLEMTAMMALQGSCAIYSHKPFFPDDIVNVISVLPYNTVLVTTPTHLRVLVKSGLLMPKLAQIVSATAFLPKDIALETEIKMQAPLIELYGCTEAGGVATRCSISEECWHLLDGMHITQQDKNYLVHGDHLQEPALLQDNLQLQSSGGFKLLGRSNDLVNVGGKRSSLAHLNQLLLSIEEVEDGVIYMPDTKENDDSSRPVAFVVTSLSKQEILKILSASVDPVFLPRPLIKVNKIDRNETGKISLDKLKKMLGNPHA